MVCKRKKEKGRVNQREMNGKEGVDREMLDRRERMVIEGLDGKEMGWSLKGWMERKWVGP